MPVARVPKNIPRQAPPALDKRSFRVGHGSRGVPTSRLDPVFDLQQHQQHQQQDDRYSHRSQSAGFAPLFDGDNDTLMSDPVAGPGDDEDNEDENEDEDDDDEDDAGAIDQNAILRERLERLMVDDIDYNDIDPHEILPAGFDEEQLRLDMEYAEREFDRQEPDTIAFDEDFFEDDIAIEEWMDDQEAPALPYQTVEPGGLLGVAATGNITDKSTLIHHHCNKSMELSDFQMGFGLYAHISRMKGADYTILRQLLGSLRGQDGKPVLAVERMPKQLQTLKGHVESRLPLLDMRVANVPLQVEKMKTESASRKRQQQQQQQQEQAMRNNEQQQDGSDGDSELDSESDPATVMDPLFFMDPHALFQAFLNSDTAKDMHKGMAHLVDNPTELHHALCWSSSVRTTSGEYAHFIGNSDDVGKAIFPSDFIYFQCLDDDDCACRLDDPDDRLLHIGRVKAVGKNYSKDYVDYAGEITLVLQECITIDNIDDEFPGLGFNAQVNEDMDFKKNELVLRFEEEHWIPQYLAMSFASVHVDYFDGDVLDDPSPPVDRPPKSNSQASRTSKPKPRKRKLFYKYSTIPDNPRKKGSYLVRRALQRVERPQADGFNRTITPLAFTAPPRAQLELKTYGREVFEQQWDRVNNPGLDVLSCPVLTFIDGFGVYRNARRSVMGMYQSPAGLSYGNQGNKRARNANIFPIVLGPHAANFDAVVNAMGCLMPLDKGVMMEIQGRPTLVSVFTMCYTGDMPQQDKNSGTMGPTGLKFCRFCFIGPDHVINKQNVIEECTLDMNRYHHQHLQMRHEAEVNIRKKGDKKAYRTQWGIGENRPALFDLTPALDVIMTRAPDPAHSEYKGMVAHMHDMILDAFLTPQARLEYGRTLKSWPFPPGWSALPSPLSYLKGYDLSHHGRWSIIAPALFEAWLEKDHINPYVWDAWKEVLIEHGTVANPADSMLVSSIPRALAMMAKSNCLLMNTRNEGSEYRNMNYHIKLARHWYKMMCHAAAEGVANNPRTESFKNKARATELPSEVSSRRSSMSTARRSSQAMMEASQQSSAPIAIDDDTDDDLAIQDEPAPVAEAAAEAAAESRPLPKRAKQYITSALRPNVHLGIHYADIYEEYGPPGLLNVLAEEKYHKRLKKTAETTNGRDVERWILQHERIVHTIRFVLLNAFALSDPNLTQQMNNIARQSPSLFERLLQREELVRLGLEDDEEKQLEIDLSADDTHVRPAVTGKFKEPEMRRTRHPICGVNMATGLSYTLPVHSSSLPDVFRRALCQAYALDYGMPHILSFPPGKLQYSEKVSFSDEAFKRYTFRIGDHIRYRQQQDFARIDHIFTHEMARMLERRIFLVLTRMVFSGHTTTLDLKAVEDTNEPFIVGLPAVRTERVYIIDISKIKQRRRGHQPKWAWVDWDIIAM